MTGGAPPDGPPADIESEDGSWTGRCRRFCLDRGWTDAALAATGLTWAELGAIAADHDVRRADLQRVARTVADLLEDVPGLHSVRTRVKDPLHVAEKAARKRRDDPRRAITRDTYRDELTDLVGVRVLHLDKRDWRPIHDGITARWELREAATAYEREGDDPALHEAYSAAGCVVKPHPAHYRSVHYVVDHRVGRMPGQAVELQVRTLFEEGWSEVDHQLRYPYGADLLTKRMLDHLNRVAGVADELSTFAAELHRELQAQAGARAALERTVGALQVDASERDALRELLDRAGVPRTPPPPVEVRGVLTGGMLVISHMFGTGTVEGTTDAGEMFSVEGLTGEGGFLGSMELAFEGSSIKIGGSFGGARAGRGTIRVGARTYAGIQFGGDLTVEGSGVAGPVATDGGLTPVGTVTVRARLLGTYGAPMMTAWGEAPVRIVAEGRAAAFVSGYVARPEAWLPTLQDGRDAIVMRTARYVLLPPPPTPIAPRVAPA